MLLTQFLNLIIPSDGYKCWVEITKDKKVTQGLVPTTEELAARLLEIDGRGVDAYFAVAAFSTPQNRRVGNVKALQCFIADIDAGPGKAYATADEAIDACDQFCARAQLPLPGIVRSGGGIHVYWCLDAWLDAGTWRNIAARLKLLMQAYGFHADPSRTADAASILRPVGTKNYKLPNPRSVESDGEDGWERSSAVAFIEAVLSADPSPPSAQPSNPAINSQQLNVPLNINSALTGGIAVKFDAFKGVAEGGRNQACASYAGTLLRKGYGADQVLQECLRWNELNQPPLPEQEVHTTVASICRREMETHPPALPAQEAAAMPPMPSGYKWGPQQQLLVAIKELKDDGSEVEKLKIVSDYPVYPAVFLNQEGHIKRNSYLFKSFNPVSGWNEFCLNSDIVNGKDFYVKLVENGVSIPAGMDKYFKTYVREAERMLRKEHEITRYNQFGWKGEDSFLVGEALITKGQPQKAYGTDRMTALMRTMSLPAGSSLEQWTEAADKFFTPGLEAHAFALLCSFAAPLMKYCAGLGDGGSILALMSDDSGKGKTPTSEAIASVWGEMSSVLVTGNFTQNRLIDELVRRCNLPLVQEEMTMADPVIAAESVKKFTTGCDRGRLDRTGAATAIPERYQTILISISNTSLHDMVAPVDRAASRRIMEVEVEVPDKELLSNIGGITRDMMRNRGHAGRRFAQILTSPGLHRYLTEHLTGATAAGAGSVVMHYRNELQTDPEHRFIVWLLSTVHVAAYLLTHYQILHFDVARIMTWAMDKARKMKYDETLDDPLSKLNTFLSEHADCCLVVKGPYAPKTGPLVPIREPQRYMYMRLELDTKKLYILQSAVRKWCERKRVPFKLFGMQLVKSGVVTERSRQITIGAGTTVASMRAYCWELDMSHPAMSGVLREVTASPLDNSVLQSA